MSTSLLPNAQLPRQNKTLAEKCRAYSIRRVFGLALANSRLDGLEAEVSQQLSRDSNEPYDPRFPIVPWAALQSRTALIADSGPAAGYLVGAETLSPLDILRPYSVVAQAGVTALPNLTANVLIPRSSGTSTIYWQSNETVSASTSLPALGQSAMSPKVGYGIIEVSRQLLLQSAAQDYVSNELTRTAGTAVDKAVIAGAGSSGQPTGIITQALSANIISGASFAFTTSANMKSRLAQANVSDDRIAFIGTPQVRELLEARQRFTGSNSAIWDQDKVSDRAAMVSSDLPASTLIAANWAEVIFATWGEGFQIDLNPFDPSNFKSGVVQIRISFACDVALAHAGAVVVANSIT